MNEAITELQKKCVINLSTPSLSLTYYPNGWLN